MQQLIGLTIQTAGEIMVALTVIMVHYHVLKEHKVDEDVFRTMKKEQKLAILGIACIGLGYALQVYPLF
ncbi:hypothetical protein A2W39_00330 [Candidatus Azambacteria bacterium RIFCSPHIGHO2_01_46_10]|uniref:Uncharacterized protein n=11 Tax=Candidatus Azamiibacteriota TaxID=1752741 RepID=A0A1F5C952_9BACT|nr:MAG: hypothetical protein UX27_C0003G0013 [Candidatus Azambacteria bacterium GW2011_GWA2_45_90]KKU22084.1 MAG: hypothetical protein UX33_C0016G0011 [Candidatus Azambacteria bacterium GW2011_GWC1_46_13]KKU36389.1 MAG: hypothetical protein UX48_C0006G0011 [Candidatus Azambacteria bacterium GW2011_GWB1_46_27]KKU38464.1 MAG: hypothetical protein UX51_C0001G0016 [Candidatus Azambacteria bacterium GW2011_GWF2_46_32]KKU39515.1 MAG: hypothetical protein UX53_C0004G0016 [Candidatus Azambacteria bacte